MKVFKKYGLLALSFFLLTLTSCEEDVSKSSSLPSVVGIQAFAMVEANDGESITTEGKVFASEKSSSDRTFNLIVDTDKTTIADDNYTLPATVTIPAGSLEGTFAISLNAESVGNGQQLHVALEPVVGVDFPTAPVLTSGTNTAESMMSNKLILYLDNPCTETKFRVQIATDQYGSETSWELYDSALNIVASGGPYADQAAPGVYLQPTAKACITPGDYTFVIYDAYGDGMNSGAGEGYYRVFLYDSSGNEVQVGEGSAFTDNEITEFTVE